MGISRICLIVVGWALMGCAEAVALGAYSAVVSSGDPLREFCDQKGGRLMNEWRCPASQELRKGRFCEYREQDQSLQVVNGCTGAVGNYAEIFFPACVAHDLCYHNEPKSYGKSKEDCDREFYDRMIEICKVEASGGCRLAANAFYYPVSVFGGKSWVCSKEQSRYLNFLSFEDLLNAL